MFRHSICLCLVAAVALSGFAVADEKKAPVPGVVHVFTHTEKLTLKDTLTDGDKGTPIEITSDTVLIWVDLMPGARFAHDTEYVLISAAGTKVVKGNWWPVLNGRPLFRTGGEKPDKPVQLGDGGRGKK